MTPCRTSAGNLGSRVPTSNQNPSSFPFAGRCQAPQPTGVTPLHFCLLYEAKVDGVLSERVGKPRSRTPSGCHTLFLSAGGGSRHFLSEYNDFNIFLVT